MANTKERIDALEAQVQRIVKCDEDAPGILKQISLRLDALEVNVEATDNARYAENMDWEGKFQELQDRKSGVGFKAKPDASTSGEVKKPTFRGCFLCQGPHVIANCPQRQMMNAFFDNMGQVQREEQSGSQSRHPPTEEQTDTQDYEEEDAVGAFPQWCNAVTTQVGNPEESSTGEKPKDMPPKKKSDVPGKGLMYVDIKVNGKAIRAMVDTGATHNYISSTEVERLGLTLEKGCGRVKAINSAAQPVAGIARSILIKIGPYEGRTNFSVVIMDDFKLILGLEFLRDTKTTVMPCTNSLAMLGSKPCVIPTLTSKQARWQELLAEFNFMLEYRAGSTNNVADALSRRAELNQVALMAMNAIVRADSRVAINIGQKIKKALTRDPVAQQLLKLIESGKTRQFWQEDGLLMTKGRRVYVPRVDDLRQTLIRECHDTLWAGHAGGERTLALLQQGKSAFEIVNGQQPLLPHTVNVPKAGKSPRAISFSEEWRQNIDLAQSYLEKAARRMKKHADKNRRSQEFNVGEKVMVKLLPQDRKFLRGRDSRLLQKYEGPLTIVKKIGKMAYKVDPPNWWSRQLHPVFHVSMLKPFYEDTADPSRGQIKRPGLKPKAAGKRVAEAILNDRIVEICWRTLLARGKSSATYGFLCAIKGHRVSLRNRDFGDIDLLPSLQNPLDPSQLPMLATSLLNQPLGMNRHLTCLHKIFLMQTTGTRFVAPDYDSEDESILEPTTSSLLEAQTSLLNSGKDLAPTETTPTNMKNNKRSFMDNELYEAVHSGKRSRDAASEPKTHPSGSYSNPSLTAITRPIYVYDLSLHVHRFIFMTTPKKRMLGVITAEVETFAPHRKR
ncbi:hypothetical protein RJ640_001892 [Escallonia rubra]|uniref:Tf2-1-like SH3-like domain-containing protein n=1 Tax=Escallonia rubra TaxID=112253 RepID=A0AA88QLA5_9ASTE|nr:hypothetical protein RJ640_001892 [Escallonia rubra]